jgi:hypothetical protein
LIVSIDSIEGFLVYKGTVQSGAFNCRAEISYVNLNLDDLIFVSWWSPGQWLCPGLFSYLLGIKLGVSAIIITILCSISGFVGFYKLFRFFEFSKEISLYSLLLIFCSYTFFYSFIVYQGGEILSFGIFPWFVYYLLWVRKPSALNLLVIAILFLLCFIAKTTLVVYCCLVIFYKIVSYFLIKDKNRINNPLYSLLYSIPCIVCCLAIYYLFINKGNHPTLVYSFNPSATDFFIPLASPLISVASIQEIIDKTKVFGLPLTFLYFSLTVVIIFFIIKILKNLKISFSYRAFSIILYMGIASFFIFSYVMDTNVDKSSRHFKLLGYIFLPGMLTVIINHVKKTYWHIGLIFICLSSFIMFIYLKHDWAKGRYVSINYFYRNYDNKINIDKLNKESYEKLIYLSRIFPKTTIFFIKANLDIAMDIPNRSIIPWKNLFQKYNGHGPVIIACLPRDIMSKYPWLLQYKFPNYTNFRLIDQTKSFLYIKCE